MTNEWVVPITDNYDCQLIEITLTPDWILYGGFVPIVFGIAAMFWGLTFICEEYCVPAITIYCIHNKVSDNVAGSIFIGAGLSLPVLFSSYVGLFASTSSIGLGTVLGGNIFNQTVNIAGSILVAPNRRLKLSKIALSREVSMYFISNLLIIFAIEQDIYSSLNKLNDPKLWSGCLSIPWPYSFMLVLCYSIYCLVVAYGSRVIKYCSRFFNVFTHVNPVLKAYYPSAQDIRNGISNISSEGSPSDEVMRIHQFTRPFNYTVSKIELSSPMCSGISKDSTSSEINSSAVDNQSQGDLDRTETADFPAPHDFILLKKTSSFKWFCADTWKIRYCSFHESGYMSYRNKKEFSIVGRHARYVDLSNSNGIVIQDSTNFQFLIHANYPEKRTFHFQALDEKMYLAITERLIECSNSKKCISGNEMKKIANNEIKTLTAFTEADWTSSVDEKNSFGICSGERLPVSEGVWKVPENQILKIGYYLMHPMRLCIFYTIPDVKIIGAEKRASLSILMCVLWMAIQSYIIIKGLDVIGSLLQIGGTIMGLTVGALAASYPALWSSIVVARDGYGDIASCNAFGSNVFNNFLGLGLPWLTYSLINNNRPYSDIQNNGVVLAFILLNTILVAFYAIVAHNHFVLNYWMAIALLVVYVFYIIYLCYFSSVTF